MFIVRSLFWLTAAFMVIAPQVDIQETARTAPWAAFNATQSAIASHAPHLACDSFECVAARTLLASATSDALGRPAAPAPAPAPVPAAIAAAVPADPIGALIAGQDRIADTATAPSPIRRPAAPL